MIVQNARRAFNFGNACLGTFRPELPQPTKWALLLVDLGLDDSQALEVVKTDSERGEQLRGFVMKSLGLYFVPEAVIEATRRRRKAKRVAISSASQRMAIDSRRVGITSGQQV
jgi:hypothetical protein